jgi:transcription elongation factor Elf1
MSKPADTDAAESLRYVFASRIRCPRCNSVDLRTVRSVVRDDARQKTTVCRHCGWRFYVILE